MKTMYAALLPHVSHRADLNYLLDNMGAELAVGHSYVRGGDMPDVPQSPGGLLGADLVAGISGTAALIGNVGPGFGSVGPMASFADLHPLSRIVLTLEMWIGRLEILTVLVLFHPEVWRTARWEAE